VPLLLIVLLVLLAIGVPPASACETPIDGLRFRAEAPRRLRCERQRLLGSGETCANPGSTCAAQLDRLAVLAFGGASGPASPLSLEWRCQRAIAQAAQAFLRRRITDLISGERAAPEAAKAMRRVATRCTGAPLGGELPTVGDVCASIADPFEPTSVTRCLRGALEAMAQEVTGVELEPNVLFVLTDDQRADTMWAMPRTRALVGERGVEFTESFTSTSLCCPDRASILTGLYAHNHGVTSNAGAFEFDHGRDTIARQLQENAGYRTALLGKYMVNTGQVLGTNVPPGWDEWQVFLQDGNDGSSRLYYDYDLNENGVVRSYGATPADYSTDLLRDRALALMRTWRAEPWFIEVAFYAPHVATLPAPRHAGAFAGIAPHRPPSYLEADIADKPAWLVGQQFFVLFDSSEPAATDARRIGQLETLLAVDEAVEAFSDELEELGLADNTVVVFTSDNGYLWLEHWLRLKNYPYEESIRVPLLIRYPKVAPAPGVSTELVQSIDFYPTLTELAGLAGEPVNGRSIVPLLAGEATGWRDAILFEHFHQIAGIRPHNGVRTHQWKLIDTDASSGVTLELYDLQADPYELENVADEPANAAVIADLQARLAQLLAE
jgi:N-acetylglucosamine-6-sulfatase